MDTRNLGVLALLISAWYVCSLLTDLLNKEVQTTKRIPSLLTSIQFLVGGVCSSFLLHGLRLYPFKAVPTDQMGKIYPLVSCWTLGFLTINFSFGQTAVSFTHAVRATEPLFLVAIALLFFRKNFTRAEYLSLVPIVFGIALVAATDLHYSFAGFISTCISNVCFTTRSLLAKDLFATKLVDDTSLFFYLSWYSFLFTLPAVFYFDAATLFDGKFWTGRMALLLLGNGLLHFAYNQLSFIVLTRMSPLAHTIGNAARRFFIIMASVAYYNLALTPLNKFGTALLLGGVGLYIHASSTAQQRK